VKWKEAKQMFISFRFEAKQGEKRFRNQKQNEAKRKIFGSETKRKYGVFVSHWLKTKNSKRKEAKWSEKKKIIFAWACETHAKRISFRFVSLWSEKFVEAKMLSMGVRLRAKHSLQRHSLVWPDWPKFLAGTWQQCGSGLHGAGSATRQGSSGIYYTVYIQQQCSSPKICRPPALQGVH
jgi:hypothetical protein